MQSRLKYLAPLGLLILILAMDKLALIPTLRDAGRRESTPMENIAINLDRLLAVEYQNQSSRASDYSPPILFLGSSRSEMFQALHPNFIKIAPGVDDADRRLLLSKRYETRSIVRAADAWLQYIMLDAIIRSKLKPEIVMIELSPEMFNAGSPYTVLNHIQTNVYNEDQLWALRSNSRGKAHWEATVRLCFLSYNYGFRPEKAINNLIKRKNYLESAEMALLLLTQQKSVQVPPADYEDYAINQFPEDQYKARIIEYTDHLMNNDILRNYKFSHDEKGIFLYMLDRLKESKIKAIFWNPAVHPVLEKARSTKIDAAQTDDIARQIRAAGFTYIQLKPEDLDCKLWTDSSHLSDRCAPEAMAHLLKQASANQTPATN